VCVYVRGLLVDLGLQCRDVAVRHQQLLLDSFLQAQFQQGGDTGKASMMQTHARQAGGSEGKKLNGRGGTVEAVIVVTLVDLVSAQNGRLGSDI